MTRALILSVFLIGCGDKGPVAKSMIAAGPVADVDPLTEVTISEDCKDGGTYQYTASLDVSEDPSELTLSAEYTYTECIEKDDTTSGTVSYRKTQAEVEPGKLSTAIEYSAALTFVGDHVGTCTASLAYTDESKKPEKISATKSCPHPFGKHLQKAEKCEIKSGGKKPKKKDCKIF